MTEKTFTVAGTSIFKGVEKVRLANGKAAARAKVFGPETDKDVKLFDLPEAMIGTAACAWLIANKAAAFTEKELAAIKAFAEGGKPAKAPKAAKEPRAPKAPKAPKTETKNEAPALTPEQKAARRDMIAKIGQRRQLAAGRFCDSKAPGVDGEVNKSDIEFEIDEDQIPAFIKDSFARYRKIAIED